MRAWALLTSLGVVACHAAPDTGASTTPTTGTEPTTSTWSVPDPGTTSGACFDTEPNDTPDQAVPCGLVHEDPGLGTGAVYPLDFGKVGPNDPVDWYAFRTGPDTDTLHQFAWWEGVTANLVDLVMYEVEDGVLTEIWVGDETATDGENLDFLEIAVRPDTTHLLEVRRVEGVGDYGL